MMHSAASRPAQTSTTVSKHSVSSRSGEKKERSQRDSGLSANVPCSSVQRMVPTVSNSYKYINCDCVVRVAQALKVCVLLRVLASAAASGAGSVAG
eukprot:2769-Heterococcus_DN1.PRE.2